MDTKFSLLPSIIVLLTLLLMVHHALKILSYFKLSSFISLVDLLKILDILWVFKLIGTKGNFLAICCHASAYWKKPTFIIVIVIVCKFLLIASSNMSILRSRVWTKVGNFAILHSSSWGCVLLLVYTILIFYFFYDRGCSSQLTSTSINPR